METQWSKGKIMRAAAVVLVAVMFGFGLLANGIWRNYRDAVLDRQKEQMLLTAESVSRTLEVSVQRSAADLDRFCTLTEAAYEDPEMEPVSGELIRSYIDEYDNFVTGVIVQAPGGTVKMNTQGVEVARVLDKDMVNDSVELAQTLGTDGRIYLLLREQTNRGDTISLVIDADSYYQSLISDIQLGENGYIMVKNSQGAVLMHPVKEQLGYNAVGDRKEMYHVEDLSSLENMLQAQYEGKTGVQVYDSYWWQDPNLPKVTKISAYTPANIGGDFLIISAVMDYDDVYMPVLQGFQSIIGVMVLMFAAIAVVIGVCARLVLQRQEASEEIAYLRDLNDILQKMKRSEETIAHQQRLQIMGTMTGGIAHEFNNLLTPIMGYADILMMELPEGSEEYDNVSEIYDAAEKAKEIIQQLSTLSRRNMETAFKELSVRTVLTRAVKMVRSVCPVNVQVEEQFGEELNILGNRTQINQVILNICVNAIHAIGDREGTICIREGSVSSGELAARHQLAETPRAWKRFAQVDIEDNGCGMTKEVLDQIFDPFFTTKKNGKGTGLGLSLVEQIVNSHKGYIFAESQVGKGSVFHLYFPVLEEQEAENGRTPGMETAESGRGLDGAPASGELSPHSILIVHRNAKVLRLLEKNFAKVGFAVTSCMDFNEALEALASGTFDIMAAEEYVDGAGAVDFFMSVKGLYKDMVRVVIVDRVSREVLEAKQRELIDGYTESPVSVPGILGAARR